MSFYGSSFIFDGVPSEAYGLMIADVGNARQSAGILGGAASVHEDRLAFRATGLHYGSFHNTALSFPIVFTVQDGGRRLDRYELAAVAGWLSGHANHKELSICQPDMEGVFFRCIITELEAQEVGMQPVGFQATVTCDGPYAYRRMADTHIDYNGHAEYLYRNHSNVNEYYRPVITIESAGTQMRVENLSDRSVFSLDGMPDGNRTITIDALNQVMTSSDGINLYQYWNEGIEKRFPQFLRGDNRLEVTGTGMVTIQNTFPWNVGS